MALKNAFENLAVESKQDTANTTLQSIDSKDFATQTTLQSIDTELATQQKDALTDAELRAADVQVNDDVAQGKLDTVNTNLGTDGAAAPTIPGTGVRGWLRSIYDKLTSGVTALLSNENWKSIYLHNIPSNPPLPSGSAITVDPVLNTEPNVIDSGWIRNGNDTSGLEFINQSLTVGGDVDLRVYVINANDDQGNGIRNEGQPFLTPAGFETRVIGGEFFGAYFRVIVENISGSTCNQLNLSSKGGIGQPMPLTISIDAPVFGSFPGIITTNVNRGRNEVTGVYNPVELSGNNNLLVALGDRISQTKGRSHKEVNIVNPTANSILYTVPAGFNYYVTSTHIHGANSSTSARLIANVRDGAGGIVKGGVAIEQSTIGLGGVIKVATEDGSHPEPLIFTNTIYWEVVSGGFSGSAVFVGYLEPV